jgi:hypothetical protein
MSTSPPAILYIYTVDVGQNEVREALTRAQLHNIGVHRNPNDINTLLWEIKRLRALVLRIDQLQRSLAVGGELGLLLQALHGDLAGELCIAEQSRIDLDHQPKPVDIGQTFDQ